MGSLEQFSEQQIAAVWDVFEERAPAGGGSCREFSVAPGLLLSPEWC